MTFPLEIDLITSISFVLIIREPLLPRVTSTNSHKEERYPWQSAKLSFLNKCEEVDKEIINEYYQRCFGREILENERKKES